MFLFFFLLELFESWFWMDWVAYVEIDACQQEGEYIGKGINTKIIISDLIL